MKGESLSVQQLAFEYNVSTRSITRDMNSLKGFLADHTDILGYTELEYSSTNHCYSLKMRYTATWNKVSGAMGYQCQLKTYCWSEWNTMYEKKSKSNRSVSIEGSDIEKIKIRVRAYKKVNGISVYGPWSNTRSKKCW